MAIAISTLGLTPDELTPEQFGAANHALSTFELMGFLVCRRYISHADTAELWGVTVARVHRAAEATGFLALRDTQNGKPIWPHFREFVRLVEADVVKAAR